MLRELVSAFCNGGANEVNNLHSTRVWKAWHGDSSEGFVRSNLLRGQHRCCVGWNLWTPNHDVNTLSWGINLNQIGTCAARKGDGTADWLDPMFSVDAGS